MDNETLPLYAIITRQARGDRSQEEFAEWLLLNTNPPAMRARVSGWERGVSAPDKALLLKTYYQHQDERARKWAHDVLVSLGELDDSQDSSSPESNESPE